MKKGSRVSWVYAGKRTFGKVVSANAGTRAKIKQLVADRLQE